MQHADGPAEIEALAQPARHRGARVQVKAVRFVPRSDRRHRIATQFRTTRDLGQNIAIWPAEPKLAIRLSLDLVAFLMNGAMVPTAEQGEVRERGGPAVGPVLNVMALAETSPTAGESAAAVSVMERSPDRRRN